MVTGISKRIQNRTIDRLSDLPDCILHHILSFLDTKSSVQTSILSRRWISLWKYVPVLTFLHSSFETNSSLFQFGEKVISLRCDNSSVARVIVEFRADRRNDLEDRIIKYAASHGVQELVIFCSYCMAYFPDFGSVCGSYRSLKVMNLTQINIGSTEIGSWSCLRLLESLTLTHCLFTVGDAFANLPRLENLKLISCTHFDIEFCTGLTKITGLKLRNLEIVFPHLIRRLEVFAPELQSLCLTIDAIKNIDMSKSYLPSLNRAKIEFSGKKDACSSYNDADKKRVLELWVSVFKIVHNVQTLNLRVDPLEFLIEAFSSMERQSSPFKRMKSLNLKCFGGGSIHVPDQVVCYFLGSSPNGENKRFTVKMGR